MRSVILLYLRQHTYPTARHVIHVHASCTSCDLSPLCHALQFSSSLRNLLAFHVVVIERSAPSSNEKGSTHKRCRASTNLLDFGDTVWKWSEVVELLARYPVDGLAQFPRIWIEYRPCFFLSARHGCNWPSLGSLTFRLLKAK